LSFFAGTQQDGQQFSVAKRGFAFGHHFFAWLVVGRPFLDGFLLGHGGGSFWAVKIRIFGLPQAKKPLPQGRRGTNMYE
jgi:hypothetical protein